MLHALATKPGKQKANPLRATTRGIKEAAAALGVHRATLWRTLKGKTANPKLLSRYQSFVALRAKKPNRPR